MDQSEVMTLPEVATYLQCHPTTVYRMVKAGDLPAFRLGGDWRFLRSDVDRWITGKEIQPPEKVTEKPSDGRIRGKSSPKRKR